MDGLPVTVRLIDPPLHEFLPDLTELSVKLAVQEAKGETVSDTDKKLLEAVRRLHEQNPMLGLRGVRLGLVIPGLFALQVRAIAEAAAQLKKDGKDPQPEIMVPLVGAVQELEVVREEAERILADVAEETGVEVDTLIGTMIEVPRAALTAGSDRRGGRLLLLRHQRPDPDGLGVQPRRRRGRVLLALHRPRHLRSQPVRDARREGIGRLVQIATEEGRATRARPQGRRLRRARRRPRVGPLLPRGGPRLRVLLAVPGAGRAARGRPRGARDRRAATAAETSPQ